MKPPADFQWRDYYCLCVAFPQPSANRWEDDNGWRVGGLRKDAGWKEKRQIGVSEDPHLPDPIRHKPPARCVRLNAFLMLHLSAVCLFVGLFLIFISKVSFIFWQTQKCSMGKIFQKTVGDKLQSNSTGWNIYLRCSARHATQLCLAPPFPYVYGCMLPDVIEVKCLCLRVQQLHLGFHPEKPPIYRASTNLLLKNGKTHQSFCHICRFSYVAFRGPNLLPFFSIFPSNIASL